MKIIAYYEGNDAVREWLTKLINQPIEFRPMPSSNYSKDFTGLPAYVADILYLDKPDIILAGSVDDIHEKPIFSIEFAACTPQYQHALQRFSRMVASVVNGCPAVIVMPAEKIENMGGARRYKRSKAVEYGAVKLMDICNTPAFVFDWPTIDGVMQDELSMQLPKLDTPPMKDLAALIQAALQAFSNLDYVQALWKQPLVKRQLDVTRHLAYENGIPTISNPGGEGTGGGRANLELIDTQSFLEELRARPILNIEKYLDKLPGYFQAREKTLVFKPSRITKHAGDPYVGMVSYYDIAFCRSGRSSRERFYNLVADASVSRSEIVDVMQKYNSESCPFSTPLTHDDIEQYGHHLRHGCKFTKIKPIRIYSELTDMVVFTDGVIF